MAVAVAVASSVTGAIAVAVALVVAIALSIHRRNESNAARIKEKEGKEKTPQSRRRTTKELQWSAISGTRAKPNRNVMTDAMPFEKNQRIWHTVVGSSVGGVNFANNLIFPIAGVKKATFCCSEDDRCNPVSRDGSPNEGTCLVIALNVKVRRHRQRGRVVFLEWRGTEKQDGVGRGEERCDRAKALGSNSLKCPVVRKKPLRVKNSLPWCVGARSLDTVCVSTPAVVWSIAFRSLFFLLGIILVFMASIKCTVDSSTFRDSTLLARAPLPNRPPLLAECLNLTSHPHL